jgi:DNA repair exonuclease SbcCD ATPase subunit
MSLDPKVRQSLAAVSGESVAMCFGRDLRAAIAALDEAESDLDVALAQLVEVKRERDQAVREKDEAEDRVKTFERDLAARNELTAKLTGLFGYTLPSNVCPNCWGVDGNHSPGCIKAAGLEDA